MIASRRFTPTLAAATARCFTTARGAGGSGTGSASGVGSVAGGAAAGPKKGQRVAAALDIDGVLRRGSLVLPGAPAAIQRLRANGIPFVFMTNGGGVLEAERAKFLADMLSITVDPADVVLCHTPIQTIAKQYAGKRVLILGSKKVMEVAAAYGMDRAVSVQQLLEDDPTRYPFHPVTHKLLPYRDEPFAGVFLFHDPINWAPEVQIAVDVLRGGVPLGSGMTQAVPFYSCNPDMIFASSYPVSRFAAGAFTMCVETLFHYLTGHKLDVQLVGKPERITYEYVHNRLLDAAGLKDTSQDFHHIFMVGDNPSADIKGANQAGGAWRSVLVRTGVFQGPVGSNDPVNPAHHVVADINEAVDLIIKTSQTNPKHSVVV